MEECTKCVDLGLACMQNGSATDKTTAPAGGQRCFISLTNLRLLKPRYCYAEEKVKIAQW